MDRDETRKKIIENYVNAYNNFDVETLLKDVDEKIVFRNISNGELNLFLNGIDEFRAQAEHAVTLFSEREQKITGWKLDESQIEINIFYQATLAVDLPENVQAGSKIELEGKSIFRFDGDKIVEIEDIS